MDRDFISMEPKNKLKIHLHLYQQLLINKDAKEIQWRNNTRYKKIPGILDAKKLFNLYLKSYTKSTQNVLRI